MTCLLSNIYLALTNYEIIAQYLLPGGNMKSESKWLDKITFVLALTGHHSGSFVPSFKNMQ